MEKPGRDDTDPPTGSDGQADTQAPILPKGTVIDRYIVSDLIGAGGMGMVYRAFDPDLNRPVALKLLNLSRSSNDTTQAHDRRQSRMLREAQALAQLSHPNVVAVHDVGTTPGGIFMAMEYVAGKNFREYLREGGHTRAEILGVLLAAGRGLAAAHKTGIVHRDFKPTNLVIGVDGRVRVVDFGLARAEQKLDLDRVGPPLPAELIDSDEIPPLEPERVPDAADQLPVIHGGLLAQQLTRTDAVMGTPLYMSPEQYLNKTADAKSDQFCFCLVAFEALYGKRPFSGRSQRDLNFNILRQQIVRPVPHDIPSWLDRVLQRGLRPNPRDRFGSMEELLQALQDDPTIARRRSRMRLLRFVLAICCLGVAGFGGWGIWFGTTRGARLCAGSDDASRFRDIWDPAVQAKVETAFLKTGRSYAMATFERVVRLLDDYTRLWVTMRREACEATHVRAEQSDRLMDLRMQCLTRRQDELRALTGLLAVRPDPTVLDKAVEAAAGLIDLSICADQRALAAAVPLPEDPAIRRRVAELRRRLNEATALEQTGKYTEGVELALALAREAEPVPYPPLVAETLARAGTLLERAGRYPEAASALWRAIWAADAGGHDRLRAQALIELMRVLGYRQARYEEAELIASTAGAVIEKLGDAGELRASWLEGSGILLELRESFDLALERYRAALSITERILGPDHPRTAAVHNNIGLALDVTGKFQEALQHLERAHAIWEKALGPEHPDLAKSQNNIGIVLWELGEYARSIEVQNRALKIRQDALGPEHPDLANSNHNLGLVFLDMGDIPQALIHFKKAASIWEKALAANHPQLVAPLTSIAWINLNNGNPTNARADFERVLAICFPDRCAGAMTASLAYAKFGLAKILWQTAGERSRASLLARQAHSFYVSQTSVPLAKNRKDLEYWMRKQGIKVE